MPLASGVVVGTAPIQATCLFQGGHAFTALPRQAHMVLQHPVITASSNESGNLQPDAHHDSHQNAHHNQSKQDLGQQQSRGGIDVSVQKRERDPNNEVIH